MKSVLLIDDDIDLSEALSALLSQEGYEVRSATSGERGLALALAAEPDVVMLDWQMPLMSGQEVLERLEARELSKRIPLILMSADLGSIPADIKKRHLHFRKPFDADALVVQLERIFSH